MLPDGTSTVVNDHRSMVADTDNGGIYRDSTDDIHHYDEIARYMLKGELLRDRSVPTLITPGSEDQTGDSIAIAKSLWENGAPFPELCSDLIESTAHEWSDAIVSPFYSSLGNKNDQAQQFLDILMDQMAAFGADLKGPFYYGEQPSLVDVTIYPFMFRILNQKLFQTYRSKELTESSLALLDTLLCTSDTIDNDASTTTATKNAPSSSTTASVSTGTETELTLQHRNLLRVSQWVEQCNQVPAFFHSLPTDVDPRAHYYSPRLVKLYQIYAMGIGLKGLFSGKLVTKNMHND